MTSPADVVRYSRLLASNGLVAALDGNVSVRKDAKTILITAGGRSKREITTRDIVVVGLDGHVKGRGRRPSSELPMHLAIYRARPEVKAVVHAHPPYATALAASGQRMSVNVLPEVILSLGIVPLVPYAMPSSDAVGESLAAHLDSAHAALLANHGAVTWARTLREAYLLMEKLEHAAQIEFLARLLGGPQPLTDPQVAELLQMHPYAGRKT
ncbi:MAG: class II aldolase/adducin family protein [Bacteroidetes bacterium]|jgi:L-fuculose-phosphate aldolase|nr:class II aldolase/adducin family protein [Bacteroidota bacterium]